MIPDSLFFPSQSPVSFLLKVLVFSCSKSLFRPPQPPVSFFSKSRPRPLHPLPSSRSPLPSSSSEPLFLPPPRSPVPVLSILFHPLEVLSPPLPPRQRKQRNDTKPPRRSCGWFQNGTSFFHFAFVHIRQSLGLNTWKRLCLPANCFPVLPQM